MRLATLARAVALGVLLLVPAAARADEASAVTVTLRNGAQYRGELVEKVPDDHLTIKLATGEVKTFPWAQIVTGAPTAKPEEGDTEAAEQPPPPTPKPRARPRPSATTVHIETDDEHVVLQRYAGGVEMEERTTGRDVEGDAFEGGVCEAPCDQEVPSGSYRLKAPGKTGTDVITVSGSQMTLHANMHASWHKAGAWSFLGLGLIGGLMGAGLLLGAAEPPPLAGPDNREGFAVSGAIAAAVGAGFLGLSIYCFATSTSSVTAIDGNGNETALRSRTFGAGVVVPF